ncbi:dihydrofolate reductase family protein [Phytoactinopolyspora limicola]|uniref:dihydrofolate reductase family protein n=1 Tax=Phytoactinopolyspora limicola TaxID=2715536 RepID=UPI001408B4FF|nr:dihydrofolate reductase family protein [Phytoactinopolyspora limicola]
MSKITASLFMALDGVVENPEAWQFPYFNEELGAAVNANHGVADIMVFGRKTYESFARAWPRRESAEKGDAAFAKALGDMRKIVVSNQQLEFTWRNSEQLRGDLVEVVRALKDDPSSGHIALSGSVSVVRQLLAARLVDELHLFVNPICVGTGMRLFSDGGPTLPVRLLSSQAFTTGVLHVVYGPDDAPPKGSYETARKNLA